jgi:hypothetical protein
MIPQPHLNSRIKLLKTLGIYDAISTDAGVGDVAGSRLDRSPQRSFSP